MWKRTGAIAAVLAVVLIPQAHADTVLAGGSDDVRAQYQRYVNESEVRTPNQTVELRINQAGCPQEDAVACVDWQDGHWRMFVAAGADDLRTRLLVMHEIGHVWDFNKKSGAHRRWFEDIHQYPNGPLDWFHPLNTTWEKFADAYALCAVFPRWIPPGTIDDVYPTYAYDPTPMEHLRTCLQLRHHTRPDWD